jgi:hypothetical protein
MGTMAGRCHFLGHRMHADTQLQYFLSLAPVAVLFLLFTFAFVFKKFPAFATTIASYSQEPGSTAASFRSRHCYRALQYSRPVSAPIARQRDSSATQRSNDSIAVSTSELAAEQANH